MSRDRALLLAPVAATAIIVALLASPLGAAVARGWLCAFVLVSMVPLGSLALLLVHSICGGRWGSDLAPVLIPAARCIPLLFLAFVPVVVFQPAIYRWQELGLPPDVLRGYLNLPFFTARTLVALAVWSGLAWSGAWKRPLLGPLGLVAHLILISLIPADWVMTLKPGSTSAGFGLGFGIEQMGAALALAAILAPQNHDPRASRDLAGLILTTLLGTMYFVFMEFLITWYGNIPDKVHWYASRDGGWPFVALAAFVIGAVLPFLAILNPRLRRGPLPLRLVGLLVLAGITLHIAWLTVPAFSIATLIPAAVAALLIVVAISTAARSSLLASQGHADG